MKKSKIIWLKLKKNNNNNLTNGNDTKCLNLNF